MKTIRLLPLLIGIVALNGCGIKDSIDNATSVIDRGIEDITAESSSWQTVLKRVATELPQDISEVIRQDAQQLATRSVADTGVEFKCSFDFLGNRAIQSLQRLKAKLPGTDLPPLTPAFCHVTPDSIDLKANPDSWSKVTYHGYDMDQKDSTGALIGFVLVAPDGTTTSID